MAYVKTTWSDLPSQTTPVNATNLNNMENGIEYNDQRLNGTKPMGSIVVDDVSCKNLFNFNSSKFGYVLSGTGTENSSSGFLISDYIAVQPNTTYSISRVFNSVSGAENTMRIGYYQANKTFIDRPASSDNPYTITTPSNCYYVRLSYQYQSQGQTSNDKVQIEQGSEATTYTPYKKIIKEENGYVKESTTFYANDFKCKNMFGNYVVINGWIDGTTMRVNSVNGNRMAFIPCQPNTTYTISRSVITSSFRVSDYNTIPSVTSSNVDYTIPTATKNDSGTIITYTTSSTAKYIIIHYANIGSDSSSTIESSLASIQLEIGTEATAYTPHKNFDGEIYTEGEIRIGTWIDGKPLYRKTFTFSTSGTAGEQTLSLSGLNIDVITNMYGTTYSYVNPNNIYRPAIYSYAYNGTLSEWSGAFSRGTSLIYRWYNLAISKVYLIVEYTKTTD